MTDYELYYGTETVARPARDLNSRLANPRVRLCSIEHLSAINARKAEAGSVAWPATPLVEVSEDGSCLRPVIFGSLVLSEEQRRRHCLVVGATGAGKTYIHAAGAIAQTLRSTRENLIINNTKGPAGTEEIASIVEAARPGTRVIVFAPGDPKRSVACNFVQLARASGLVGQLIRFIVDSMPRGSSDSGYWAGVAERVIGAALKCPSIDSLAALNDLFENPRLLREFSKAVAARHGERTLEEFVSFHDSGSQNAATNLTDITSRTAPFCASDSIRAVTSGLHELDPAELLTHEQPFVLIVECSEVHYSIERHTMGLFFTLFFGCMLRVADQNGGMLPRPAHFFIDEFGTMGRIPDFETLINVGRSRGFAITALVQSIAQIGASYGAVAESMLAGFNSKVFFCSGLSRLDREFASSLGGSIAVKEWRQTQQCDTEGEWRDAARSEHTVLRPLIAPDDLLLRPHPVFGGFAYAFLVDEPPLLLHFTPSWEQPIAGPAIEAARDGRAACTARPAPLPPVSSAGHIEKLLDAMKEPPGQCLPLDRSVCWPRHVTFTDTRRMTNKEIRDRTERKRRLIGWDRAAPEARAYWSSLEGRVKDNPGDMLRLAEELRYRDESITSLYEASKQAETENIVTLLHYLDFLRTRREARERANHKGASRAKQGWLQTRQDDEAACAAAAQEHV